MEQLKRGNDFDYLLDMLKNFINNYNLIVKFKFEKF